jgi:hypothetical protein
MAVGELQHKVGAYDPDVLAALQKALNVTQAYVVRQVKLDELRDGMILAADMRSLQGTLLCAKGHEVNPALRVRLRNYVCNVGLRGAIEVFMPRDYVDEEPKMPEDLADARAFGPLPPGTRNVPVNR